MKKLFVLVLCFSCLSLSARNRSVIKLYGVCDFTERSPKEHYVTIWVHGLKLFGTNKAGLGLRHSAAFCRKDSMTRVMRSLVASYTDSFSAEHVYAFVWSAEFSLKGRKKASKDLNVVLEELSKKYHFGQPGAPKLRLIGFSEGANVVVSLPEFMRPGTYVVDELLLLAGPVQCSSEPFVHDPAFKRVFNLYSSGDYIQLISLQPIYDKECRNPIFSTRRFADAPNILQVKARTNGHAMGHFGFNSPKFVVMIDPMVEQLNKWLDKKLHYKDHCRHHYILTVYPCERMMLLKHCSQRPRKKPVEDFLCVKV